jgi:hypothetical protein
MGTYKLSDDEMGTDKLSESTVEKIVQTGLRLWKMSEGQELQKTQEKVISEK